MKSWVNTMKKIFHSDGWENVVTLLGTSYDKSMYHRVYPEYWYDCDELEDMYYGDAYARRIVEEPVKSAFRQGFDLTLEDASDESSFNNSKKQIHEIFTNLNIIESYKKALYWGRLYGRAGLLLGLEDGSDLSLPLTEENISDFKFVEILECKDFSVESTYQDPSEPKYGLPETWFVSRQSDGSAAPEIIHESRILLTRGAPTSERKRRENDWRDASVLQGPYKYLRNWDAANQGSATMLTDASQAVLKIMQFSKMLGSEDISVFTNRMRVLEMARSLRIMPIDAESEEFEYVERTFSGVFELIDRAAQALAGAVGIPQTVLFGRAPAGLNATGESDIRGWYDQVESERVDEYQPDLERLVQYAAQVTNANTPELWGVSWHSLWQETEKEAAETNKLVADTDQLYLNMGVLMEEEIAETRFGGEAFDRGVIQVDFEDREILKGQDIERAQEGVSEDPMLEDPGVLGQS